jgi:hypothetical protein
LCRLLPLLALAAGLLSMERAPAQAPFPAPLPDTAGKTDPGLPPATGMPNSFPGVSALPLGGGGFEGGLQPRPTADCMTDFIPLREEAERRGRLIKAASERHAPRDEACRLISDFERAEAGMINYVEAHRQSCAISQQVSSQLGNGHKATEALLKKVCVAAEHERTWPPKGPTGDFDSAR